MNTPLAWPDLEIEVRYVELHNLIQTIVKSWFLNQSTLVHRPYILMSQWVLYLTLCCIIARYGYNHVVAT